MSFVAVAVGGALLVTAAYTGDQQRKSQHKQADALKAAQKQDAIEAASAETNAATAANDQQAAVNRRRRASALSAGAPGDTLGSTSVLGAGSQSVSIDTKTTSALGKGAG